MKHNNIIIPAQIRAGRALLGWSQEHLAKEAEVGLSTVRDAESARRAAETAAVASIRSALWNGGVVFTGGLPGEGPGVRLVADQPNIIRRPSTMQWEGLPFAVEYQGKIVTVFVADTVLEDLTEQPGSMTEAACLKSFERHHGKILDAVALAFTDPENFDQFGRLHIRPKDMDSLKIGQWHRVTIESGEDIRETSARSLMNKFSAIFMECGVPPDIDVYHNRTVDGEHVYYFSPKASDVGKDLLASFGAIAGAPPGDFASMRKIKL
jgi:DNA-binding XRE family transcriptional regulator